MIDSATRFALLVLVATIGCDAKPRRPIGTVRGTVTIAGEAVGEEGCILFRTDAENTSLMANLAEDGSFVIRSHDEPGLPVGEYRVAIAPRRVSSGDPMRVTRPDRTAKPDTRIPKRYWDFATSKLKVQVNEGENPPLVFDLQAN